MMQREREERLEGKMVFWGKVYGNENDYLVCYALATPMLEEGDFPLKKVSKAWREEIFAYIDFITTQQRETLHSSKQASVCAYNYKCLGTVFHLMRSSAAAFEQNKLILVVGMSRAKGECSKSFQQFLDVGVLQYRSGHGLRLMCSPPCRKNDSDTEQHILLAKPQLHVPIQTASSPHHPLSPAAGLYLLAEKLVGSSTSA